MRVSDQNAERLLAAFDEINASYRGDSLPLKPPREDILAIKRLLLMTDAGPLDVFGLIGKQDRYEVLSNPRSTWARSASIATVSARWIMPPSKPRSASTDADWLPR